MNSKKHKENELKAVARARTQPAVEEASTPAEASTSSTVASAQPEEEPASEQPSNGVSLNVDADADEDDVNQTLDQKIAAARSRLSPSHCLFCPATSSSLEDNLTHMSVEHSFFIPDAEYLVDLTGLVVYLGEKVAVGNVCIYCNDKGREFRTLDAVRKHMLDKSHCKIAYESDKEQLEFSDFYDFTASYPDAEERQKRREERKARKLAAEAEEGWEDDEDVDGEVDEVIQEEVSGPEASDSDTDSSDEDSLPDNQITYGDSPLELVLPSGARIGHRSMRLYYAQSFPGAPRGGKAEDPNSGAALVRRLLADKNSALVPRKGGFGAFGSGTEVVKARNRGEAREAGRHVREFRDQKRREDFKTKIGFIGNSQKHYRDPLLQVCPSLFFSLRTFEPDARLRSDLPCRLTRPDRPSCTLLYFPSHDLYHVQLLFTTHVVAVQSICMIVIHHPNRQETLHIGYTRVPKECHTHGLGNVTMRSGRVTTKKA